MSRIWVCCGKPFCGFLEALREPSDIPVVLLICVGEKVDIPGHSLTLCERVPQTRTAGNVSPRDYEE